MFSHRYRYLFITILSLYTFLNTALCNVYYYFNIDIEWYYALATIFTITFLIWEGNRLVKPYFKRKFLTPDKKIRFLSFFFIAGNLIAFVASVFVVFVVGNVLHSYSWSQNSNPFKLNIIYGSLINLFFHLLNAILFFFREYRRHWAEVEELREMRSQTEIQLVKSQINPHFLFNNLNVLSGMVIKNNPDANHFIEEFSKVYRYILTNHEKELVELKDELDFIQPYLFLLQKRFDEGLKVNFNVPEKYNNWYIVPAALQMLIENAIKHNIVSSQKPLCIQIYTNGNETLVIKNNLQLRRMAETSTKIGLQNIRKRYELISGRDVIITKTEELFEVRLPLLKLN